MDIFFEFSPKICFLFSASRRMYLAFHCTGYNWQSEPFFFYSKTELLRWTYYTWHCLHKNKKTTLLAM